MMLKRSITAIVAIVVFLPILYFSDTPIFAIALSLLSLIGCGELIKCVGVLNKWVIALPLMAFGVIFPLLPCFLSIEQVEHIGALCLAGILLYLYAAMTFSHGKLTLSDVGTAFMGVLYVTLGFTALSWLRYQAKSGEFVFLICFIGAWVTDTFAYFCGRLFGKHKLIPDVSPKKTVEGSIGGTLFCIGALPLYGWILTLIANVRPNYLLLAVSGLLVAVVSQVGDLLMSAIKRTFGIKDYGRLFPGHGGVLDRFDSVLAVALVLLLICGMGGELFEVIAHG